MYVYSHKGKGSVFSFTNDVIKVEIALVLPGELSI